MGFLKKQCCINVVFGLDMLLETTYGNYIFLKLSCRNLNICMIIYDDALYLVLHLKKCMNC